MVFKWCLNKSNEHLPPDRINISIANIPHEFKILTQPLLSGLTGWKAGWKAGWLACYSAVMADDRGSQVKVKAHDWLFCFSCKNLFCFVTKHDLCYFLNTIFVWSKFSTDFHTKIKQILDELSSQAPPEVAEFAEILKTKYWQRLFCYSCKNLALSRKNMTSVI